MSSRLLNFKLGTPEPLEMTSAPAPPEVQVGQVLFGSSAYSVLRFLDEGAFGQVAKCKKLDTKEMVAVKIMKDSQWVKDDTEQEVSILQKISAFDADHIHVVKFIEQFVDMERHCLVFEMLDMNLFDLMEARGNKPLCLQEIRPIAKQLLVALDALKSLGVVHSDIKPDNIMTVSTLNQPLRIKLIDFGVSFRVSKAEIGELCQPIGYMAPEIALGLPFNEAIDTWGTGCILAFLYIANNLFQVDCEYRMMRGMVTLLGQPREHQLREGMYTPNYFCEDEASSTSENPTWRLLTPEEYSAIVDNPEESYSIAHRLRSLDDLLKIYPRKGTDEYADRTAFVDLLKRLLHLESDKRISPKEALQDPFITMSHLAKRSHCSKLYLTSAKTKMNIVMDSADQVDPFGDLEADQESSLYHSGDDSDNNSSAQEPLGTFSLMGTPDTWDIDSDTVEDSDLTQIQCFDEDGATLSSVSDEELQLSSGGDTPCLPDVSCLPEGPPDGSASVSSSSSSRGRKILKRIRKFFRRVAGAFCCCCCSVED